MWKPSKWISSFPEQLVFMKVGHNVGLLLTTSKWGSKVIWGHYKWPFKMYLLLSRGPHVLDSWLMMSYQLMLGTMECIWHALIKKLVCTSWQELLHQCSIDISLVIHEYAVHHKYSLIFSIQLQGNGIMEDQDLKEIGIQDECHRKLLLEATKLLPKMKSIGELSWTKVNPPDRSSLNGEPSHLLSYCTMVILNEVHCLTCFKTLKQFPKMWFLISQCILFTKMLSSLCQNTLRRSTHDKSVTVAIISQYIRSNFSNWHKLFSLNCTYIEWPFYLPTKCHHNCSSFEDI